MPPLCDTLKFRVSQSGVHLNRAAGTGRKARNRQRCAYREQQQRRGEQQQQRT